MPRLLNIETRLGELTAAFVHLVETNGLAAPSSRRLAAAVGIRLSTLQHRFETRQRLLSLLVHQVAGAVVRDASGRAWSQGAAALLPAPGDGEALRLARCYLAVGELGRAGGDLGAIAGRYEEDERWILDQATGRILDADGLDTCLAVVRGLRHAVCAAENPMSVERATGLVDLWVKRCSQPGDLQAPGEAIA